MNRLVQRRKRQEEEAATRPAGGVRIKKVDRLTGEVKIYRDGKLIKRTGGKKSQFHVLSKVKPPDLSTKKVGEIILLGPEHCQNEHGSSSAYLPFTVLLSQGGEQTCIDKRCNYCVKNNYVKKTPSSARPSTIGYGAAAAGGCC